MFQVFNIKRSDSITFNHTNVVENGSQYNGHMVNTMDVANFAVDKVLVENGSSADNIFLPILHKMNLDITLL